MAERTRTGGLKFYRKIRQAFRRKSFKQKAEAQTEQEVQAGAEAEPSKTLKEKVHRRKQKKPKSQKKPQEHEGFRVKKERSKSLISMISKPPPNFHI